MSGCVYLLAGDPRARSGRPDPVLQAFFQDVAKAAPRVAYIGTASGDDPGFFEAMGRRLQAGGAGEVELAPLCGGAADPAAARRVIEAADAVFVSGGDVAEGMDGLRVHRGVLALLRRRFEAGVPFLGLSAGSIMLARGWVRWAESPREQDSLLKCLGFAPLYCDVHGEADGWDELKALLRLLPVGTVGYGIRAGGALRICDGVIEEIG